MAKDPTKTPKSKATDRAKAVSTKPKPTKQASTKPKGTTKEPGEPLIGLGGSAISAERLEKHIAEAAKAIGEQLAGARPTWAPKMLFSGVASSLHGLWNMDGPQSRYQTNIADVPALHAALANWDNQRWSPTDLVPPGNFFEPWSIVLGQKPNTGLYTMSTGNQGEFIAKDMELFNAGFRMISFNRRGGFYTACWRGGQSGAQWAKWDLDFLQLLSWDRYYKSQGLRIVAVDRYGSYGNRYAAVWRPGTGEQILEAPGGANYLFGQPNDFLVYRYEDRGLHIAAMGHNGYPVAAYRPNTTGRRQGWTYTSVSDFKNADDYYRGQRYRLNFISHATWNF